MKSAIGRTLQHLKQRQLMACMPLPQAIGMVIVAVIYSAVVTIKGGEISPFIEAVSYKQIFQAFLRLCSVNLFNFSAARYERLGNWLYSIPNISCACNVDRYLVLRSKETAKEMTVTIIGLVLILAAATITVMI